MPGNHALIIEPVTKEDIGLYLCEASNEVGSIQAKASLTLLGSYLISELFPFPHTLPNVYRKRLSAE